MPRWERLVVDTIVGGLRLTQGVRWLANAVPADWHESRYVRSLLSDAYSVLSYVQDWQEAFCRCPALDVTTCNLNNLLDVRRSSKRARHYDLIVVLHSAAGDSMLQLNRAVRWLQHRKGRLLVFFGNEYNLMPEKIGFAKSVGADTIASQLPPAASRWLYSDCRSQVLHAPPALNPELYRPGGDVRPIDIGFRGDNYRLSIGDVERANLIGTFKDRGPGWGLVTDIEFLRYHRSKWTTFLNRSKGIVGAESGTYYLEKDDRTQRAVDSFLRQTPDATFDEVYTRFFKNYSNPVSGKAISSRHFEPIGTKTCQVLLEGQYNGILKPDEHYIAVRKDLTNLPDVIARFKDASYRQSMVDRTYEYVLDQHTYRHRVDELLRSMGVG
ncbi:MAG TPA: glycosyltransferase [Nitrospira sp.]|nr:glycosyltransferase [Nitrospira sp.]